MEEYAFTYKVSGFCRIEVEASDYETAQCRADTLVNETDFGWLENIEVESVD